ncbi:hypothetical protein BS50DRAFT_130272 [Corynespora cassiicola Philippines]|uniref:Uncharacterized protein n=1 Tax=Corynespora cassiicola Philippines TaxID=1448308 RepID=A0A2T2NBN0_CORCC|nr:hypothetical protein BS50DRAFT_130272 [Corynespora cassiicola Philippines]
MHGGVSASSGWPSAALEPALARPPCNAPPSRAPRDLELPEAGPRRAAPSPPNAYPKLCPKAAAQRAQAPIPLRRGLQKHSSELHPQGRVGSRLTASMSMAT